MHKHPLRARRSEVANLLRHAEAFGLSRMAKQRLAWFAYVLAHDGNVSLTCRYFGISRSTFIRWAKRFDPRRPETLEEHSRRPHHVRAPETDPTIIALIEQYRRVSPTIGKEKIAAELFHEHTITISASTVGRIIARHSFFFGDSASHAHKRTGIDLSISRSTMHTTPASSDSAPESGEAGALPAADLPLLES